MLYREIVPCLAEATDKYIHIWTSASLTAYTASSGSWFLSRYCPV